jgi:hypothetical protein
MRTSARVNRSAHTGSIVSISSPFGPTSVSVHASDTGTW